MTTVEKSVQVDKPLRQVYNQWTQFEDFPKFMEGVEEVRQVDDSHLHWVAEIGMAHREWDSEIVEQTPDQVIEWRSTGNVRNGGRVTFEAVDADTTRVTLRFEYDPEGFVEKAGDVLGIVDKRIDGDMKRFKEFIEGRMAETGAWRGEIH